MSLVELRNYKAPVKWHLALRTVGVAHNCSDVGRVGLVLEYECNRLKRSETRPEMAEKPQKQPRRRSAAALQLTAVVCREVGDEPVRLPVPGPC